MLSHYIGTLVSISAFHELWNIKSGLSLKTLRLSVTVTPVTRFPVPGSTSLHWTIELNVSVNHPLPSYYVNTGLRCSVELMLTYRVPSECKLSMSNRHHLNIIRHRHPEWLHTTFRGPLGCISTTNTNFEIKKSRTTGVDFHVLLRTC